MKKIRNLLLVIILFNFNLIKSSIIDTLNKTDPIPVFTSAFPYTYLYTNEKEYLKGKRQNCDPQYLSLSVSAYFQKANRGKNLDKKRAQLGDLTGRWNMIAALPLNDPSQPDVPTGHAFPAEFTTVANNLLSCAKTITSPTTGGKIPTELTTIPGIISLQPPYDLLGFFTVPIKYHKKGVRFQAEGRLFRDVGIAAQFGVSNISQLAQFVDLTTTPSGCVPTGCITEICPTNTNPPLNCLNPFSTNQFTNANWKQFVNCVHRQVMDQLQDLASASGIDLCNFNRSSIEDFHIEAFWRHAFPIDRNDTYCIAPFLFIPFASVGGSFGFGDGIDPNLIFSVPFGNNKHNAVRFNAGFTLDFYETIEIGAHAGMAHFFDRDFKGYRVPNNMFQSEFYPFTTDVKISPGDTWHIGFLMNAYHFLECLSVYLEYLYVVHNRDKICLLKPDPSNVFRPQDLECKSPWSVQLLNVGFNYDISPNFALGFFTQIPLQQKNAYRSTTYMFSLEMTY